MLNRCDIQGSLIYLLPHPNEPQVIFGMQLLIDPRKRHPSRPNFALAKQTYKLQLPAARFWNPLTLSAN